MAKNIPGLSLAPADLLRNFFSVAEGIPSDLLPNNRYASLTQSCRTAIFQIPTALDMRPGDEIIIPAYNCGSEYDALKALGFVLNVIDCEADGRLSHEKLAAAITPKTRAIYVIHLFGWPQPLEEIDTWRRQKGLYLIEDCALALFTRHPDGTPVGGHGEAAVYSLPKFLPVPDGGILSLNNGFLSSTPNKRPPILKTLRATASLIKSWAGGFRSYADPEPPEPAEDRDERPGKMPDSYFFENWRKNCVPSRLTQRILAGVDYKAISARRRENFSILTKALLPLGLDPFYSSLLNGTVPLFYPLYVPNNRNQLAASLSAAGVSTSSFWDGSHPDIAWAGLPNSRSLKKRILPLPIHQDLTSEDMSQLVSIVSQVCK